MSHKAIVSGPPDSISPVCGLKTSTPLILTWIWSAPRRFLHDLDVGLAEDDEQIAGAGGFQLAGHVQVGVHPRLQDRDAADAVELRRARVEIEGAGDHHVEPGIGRLARGVDEVRARHDAEFGADQDRGAALASRRRM